MSAKSKESFTIRRADSKEARGILDCLASAFAPYRNDYSPAAFRDTVLDPQSLQDRMNEMCVFVAVSEEKVIGTLACAVRGAEGHLRGMAVLPEWQGANVASALLKAAEDEIRNQHGKRVTLDTTGTPCTRDALLRAPRV